MPEVKKSKRGGKRPGAGRPRTRPITDHPTLRVETSGHDMLELLQSIALGEIEVSAMQLRAAIAAVQYTHGKVGDAGKKEARQEKAEAVASRFKPIEPPKLVVNNG